MYTKITFLKNKLILIIPNTINKCTKHYKVGLLWLTDMSDDVLSGVILQTSVRILVNVCFNSSKHVKLSWLWNYVTPGSLSDGGSRFLIHAMAHQKHRSQKCMDVRCTTSVRISEDLIWWRPVILTSWQWQSQLGKSPWTVFYVRTSS